MTGGRVVRMRVSPKDCMRVVDVLHKVGVDPTSYRGALSFSQACKMAFESCLLMLEQQGVIPERTGFEYSEMLAPFPVQEDAKQTRADQLKVTGSLSHPAHLATPVVQESIERSRRRIVYNELAFKRQADPDNFSEEDTAILAPLIAEFQ